MYYDSERDGVGIDLTPAVTAVNTAADAYAKIEAARAARKAAGIKPPAPVINQVTPNAPRRTSPLVFGLVALAGLGVWFVMRPVLPSFLGGTRSKRRK